MTMQVHTLIGAYVLDAVDDAERAAVKRHLAECQDCAIEVRELRATAARLADATQAEPPPGMREAVLSQARRTRQEPPPEKSPQAILQPRRIPGWRRTLVTAAIVLVVALGAGVTTFTIMQQRLDQERAQQDNVSSVLAAADADVSTRDADGGGRVTVVSSEEHDQAVVVLSDLRRIDADRSYQVWMVNDHGQISGGVARSGDTSATMLVSGVTNADLIGVTEEPSGGSSTPTLPMVADVALRN